jgi:hypothetical protein
MRVVVAVVLMALVSSALAATDPLARMDPKGVVSIIVDQAATVGVDYRKTIRRAYADDGAALAVLFKVSLAADGAGATLHSGLLTELLSRFGDRRYSAVLSRQSAKIRKRVIDDLDFDFRERKWAQAYPLTYRLAPHDPHWPERPEKT